jgi:GNAT superfamily N-acetyltransferase
MDVSVDQVEPKETYELRQQVLRPHQTVAEMGFERFDRPTTGCFAARTTDTGEIVSTASAQPEIPPWDAAAPLHAKHATHLPAEIPRAATAAAGHANESCWRLRAMATAERVRGQGVGKLVLDAVLEHVASHGGRLLWCNARIRAVPFYERAGFATLGEFWEEPFVGPHIVMWRVVEAHPQMHS